MGQAAHHPEEDRMKALGPEPPLASIPVQLSCRSISCRVVSVAMAAGMMLGMMRATAPAPGLALWTLGHTSTEYCRDYVPLVKAYLDPYRAPVSQETHEEVRRYYEGKGFQRVLIRSGKVGPVEGEPTDERLCDVCNNLLTAQRLFGRLPDADIYLNSEDQPMALRTELPPSIPPPPLSYCGTAAHHELSIPLAPLDVSHEAHFQHTMQALATAHPWDAKLNKAAWRGSSTGGLIDEANYQSLPRIRMVNISLHHPQLLDANITGCTQCRGDKIQPLLAQLGYGYGHWLSYADLYKYTLLLDIDGNGWSSRFPQLLSTNAAVIKQETRFQEWFRPLLHPYVHYLPYKEDLSDLLPQLQTWTQRPSDLQHIAANGTEAYLRLLTPSKQLCYMHLLAAEYARVQAANGTRVWLRGSRARIRQGGLEAMCPTLRRRGSFLTKAVQIAHEQYAHMKRRTAGTVLRGL